MDTKEEKFLSFSERKDRLVLTVSVLVFLSTAIVWLVKLMKSSFSTYTLGKFPFTTEQFIVSNFLASGVITVWYCLWYVTSEYFTFAEHESESIKINYLKSSNKQYINLLKTTRYCFVLSVGVSVLVAYFVNYIVLLELVIIILTAAIVLFVLLKFFRNKTIRLVEKIDRLLPESEGDLRGNELSEEKNLSKTDKILKFIKKLRLRLFGAWLFLVFMSFLFGEGVGDPTGKLTMNFTSNPKPTLNLEVDNKLPEDINVYIYPANQQMSSKPTLVLKENDFEVAYSTTMSKSSKDSKDYIEKRLHINDNYKFEGGNSAYTFVTKIDLRPYLKEGKNMIVLTFTNSGIGIENRYELGNEITRNINGYIFVRENQSISF